MEKIAEQKPFRHEGTENMTKAEYDAWTVEQIEEAKKWADENPDKMIPEREVWKALGFEY